jgi:hypothetical protein
LLNGHFVSFLKFLKKSSLEMLREFAGKEKGKGKRSSLGSVFLFPQTKVFYS